jgi:protein FAM32A
MSCEFLGGSLKLKGTLDKEIKKKKKSKKQSADKKVKYASVSRIDATSDKESTSSSMPREESKTPTTISVQQVKLITKTKAELAFERAIEKRNEERLLKRAEISHKERVENYNRQLDALTEYNDVPKVSWTK